MSLHMAHAYSTNSKRIVLGYSAILNIRVLWNKGARNLIVNKCEVMDFGILNNGRNYIINGKAIGSVDEQ